MKDHQNHISQHRDLTLIQKPHPMSKAESYDAFPLNHMRKIRYSPPKYEQESLLHQHDPYSLEEHRYLSRLQRSELRQN
jgi:hypothetical protein